MWLNWMLLRFTQEKGFLYRWQEVRITANRKYLKVNNYSQFESFFQNARDKGTNIIAARMGGGALAAFHRLFSRIIYLLYFNE